MGWVVEVLNVAVPELRALPEDMRAHFSRMVQLIQALGIERMREPMSGIWRIGCGRCA
jgi:phage-related protein